MKPHANEITKILKNEPTYFNNYKYIEIKVKIKTLLPKRLNALDQSAFILFVYKARKSNST